MSKQGPKDRAPAPQLTGIYKPDTIRVSSLHAPPVDESYPSQDIAESLNISNLSDAVASTLASDVEYRIRQVVEVSNDPMCERQNSIFSSGGREIHAPCKAYNADYLRY